MDNSWWLNLNGIKILVDPWLTGVEVDYFPWFNTQWHRTPPIAFEDVPEYDFVLITQKYPDHFHKETLGKLSPQIIIGPKSISKSVKRILPDVRFHPFEKELDFLGLKGFKIHHLPTKRKIDPIYDGLILEDGKNAVFLATHGFKLDSKMKELISSLPNFDLLLTPFNRYKLPVFLGGEVSPGLESVKQLLRDLNPKFVAATHDENKFAKGIVSKFAKITWSPSKEDLIKIPEFNSKYLVLENYQTQIL
ncbi:MAG: MBL fold metallo-hydrolase [Crocinitomicaceae bacterium]